MRMNVAGLTYVLRLLQRNEETVRVDFKCGGCGNKASAVVIARGNEPRQLLENARTFAASARCPSCGAVDRSKRRSALGKERARIWGIAAAFFVAALVVHPALLSWILFGTSLVISLLEDRLAAWSWADVDRRVRFVSARRGGKKSKSRGLRLAFVWGDALREAQLTWPFAAQPLKLGLLRVEAGELAWVKQDELGAVDPETARNDALAQLRRSSREPLQEVHPGVFSGHWEDELAASRLLVPEVFRKVKVKGELIAFTASEDTLFVAGSDDAQALRQAFALSRADLERVLADSESTAGRFTATPWVLKPSGFQPWEPPADLRDEVRALEQQLGPNGYRASA
jgi:hypothetical protein